jgi:hypothetical protein
MYNFFGYDDFFANLSYNESIVKATSFAIFCCCIKLWQYHNDYKYDIILFGCKSFYGVDHQKKNFPLAPGLI